MPGISRGISWEYHWEHTDHWEHIGTISHYWEYKSEPHIFAFFYLFWEYHMTGYIMNSKKVEKLAKSLF